MSGFLDDDMERTRRKAAAAICEPNRSERIAFLLTSRPQLITYLKMKLEAEDWHGVQDAASDLRDLDCELDGLRY